MTDIIKEGVYGLMSHSKQQIKFYILVPVYNVEKYIGRCIESVLKQTYSNFELLLVDDGSTDNAGVICDLYAQNDKRINVIHQENMGLIAARQTARKYVYNIQDSKKSFIVYLDSDDYLQHNALEILYITILKYNCDMVIYGINLVKNGKVIDIYDGSEDYCGIVKSKRELYSIVFKNDVYNSLCRKAISSTLLSNLDYSKYFNIAMGEDLLQSLEYYKNSNRVCFLNESLYNYEVNPQSITHSVSGKNYKVDFTVRQLVFKLLDDEGVFTQEDYCRFRTFCLKDLINQIINICIFNINYSQKIKLFEEIKATDYFCHYILGKSYDRKQLGDLLFVYRLFLFKKYRLLMIVAICTWYIYRVSRIILIKR